MFWILGSILKSGDCFGILGGGVFYSGKCFHSNNRSVIYGRHLGLEVL